MSRRRRVPVIVGGPVCPCCGRDGVPFPVEPLPVGACVACTASIAAGALEPPPFKLTHPAARELARLRARIAEERRLVLQV